MFKFDKINVSFDGFTVNEIGAEEAADFRDELKEKHPDASDYKFLITLTRELFVHRVTAWPYSEKCDEDNKRIFFGKFSEKSSEVMKKAGVLIEKKREELLGNLLAGVGGT